MFWFLLIYLKIYKIKLNPNNNQLQRIKKSIQIQELYVLFLIITGTSSSESKAAILETIGRSGFK
jgi:hypothetical protein